MSDLPPQYNPHDVEERLYAQWERQGYFGASAAQRRASYTIVIPPPNVTGILHMGHALNSTIQDILIRVKRMQGRNALWVPGTDHAGIATQNVVEKALAKEGKRRQDLGREAFLQRVWDWKEQYGNTIIRQLKRLGASCDWQRTRFTMDAGLSEAVTEVFLRLHREGLIYRGRYIINWCPRCQTALSDEEAPRKQTQGKLYHIRYPLEGPKTRGRGPGKSKGPVPEFIEVATTRPETMLGDTAIAVHPKDPRYASVIGQHAILPLVNRRLPIIADPLVDREFGTGAVKVTPAHDPVDFQLGKTHDLEFINVMTDDGRMTAVPEPYEGLDRFDCRSKLIVDLEREGVLRQIEEHVHNVGHCYRCDTVVEPRLSLQWFVRMKPLAAPAIRAVKRGQIRFVPDRWTKVYLNWMENIQDWCISRQIWWGHRLPVYYCVHCYGGPGTGDQVPGKSREQRGIIVAKERPERCPSCGRGDLKQDEDVLDTWFSSWLWPFSTLGWPKQTQDLKHFYPTQTLVTAPEIIFFWVARMIMAGYFCTKQAPFRDVYIHGTVRDITGKKMSKSLGNIIDPLEVIGQYGTDALRYTLVTATAVGQDIALSEERFAAGRNFANKLWNATRFALSQGASSPTSSPLTPRTSHLSLADRWILSRLQRTIEKATRAFDAFMINDAATAIYDFLWHDFCDWYIEIAKIQMAAAPADAGDRTRSVLGDVLETSLRLLHPVMPYVTEELWQHLKGKEAAIDAHVPRPVSHVPASIMIAAWPKPVKRLIDAEAEREFERLKAVIVAIRNIRSELHVPPDTQPPVRLVAKQAPVRTLLRGQQGLMKILARVGDIRVEPAIRRPKDAAAAVVDGIEILIPLAGVIDVDRERTRLQQRVDELTANLSRQDARLRNRQFVRKAPKEVVQQAKTSRIQTRQTLRKLSQHLTVLRQM